VLAQQFLGSKWGCLDAEDPLQRAEHALRVQASWVSNTDHQVAHQGAQRTSAFDAINRLSR